MYKGDRFQAVFFVWFFNAKIKQNVKFILKRKVRVPFFVIGLFYEKQTQKIKT